MIGKIGVNGLYFVVRERSPFLVLRLMHSASVATIISGMGCVRRLAWRGPRRSAPGQRQHDEKHGEPSAPSLRGYEMPIHRRDRLGQLGSLFSTLPIRGLSWASTSSRPTDRARARFQLRRVGGLLAEPSRPVLRAEDYRRPVVNAAHRTPDFSQTTTPVSTSCSSTERNRLLMVVMTARISVAVKPNPQMGFLIYPRKVPEEIDGSSTSGASARWLSLGVVWFLVS
jgi:hypothetical protein